jgi:hypothetical protein
MKTKHIALVGSILCVSLAACAPSPVREPNSHSATAKFAVAGRFSDYYARYGGAQTIGRPISSELADGAMVYQYFENGRLEYNPAGASGAEVSLSPLGLEYAIEDPPATPSAEAGALCYVETGHCITAFREYFETYGGVHFFGYPISGMRVEDNRLIQNFERATLIWDPILPDGNRIQMAPLGILKCIQVDCRAPQGAAQVLPPSVDGAAPTPTEISAPFAAFVASHGGTAVFGQALTEPAPGPDGALEQFYENAVLFLDPAAPEGVRLRGLGLQYRQPEPPVTPLADPEAYFDPSTGHNVVPPFREFFDRVGGVYVLGSPLAEVDYEAGLMVQYFENGRLEWHGGASEHELVRLSPLGQKTLNSGTLAVQPRALPAQQIVAQTWASTPVLSVGQSQVLNVRASDERGNPLAGATAQVTVDVYGTPTAYGLQPTDAAGYASLAFTPPSWEPGRFVVYRVVVEYNKLPAVTLEDQFIMWHGALPTATPAP